MFLLLLGLLAAVSLAIDSFLVNREYSRAVGCTCLLSAPPRRRAAGSIPSSVERGYTDHIGGVTSQVLQFNPSFRHEQRPQPLCLILTLELPKVNLRGIIQTLININVCLQMLEGLPCVYKTQSHYKVPKGKHAISFYSL